jgi:hypothetical protein
MYEVRVQHDFDFARETVFFAMVDHVSFLSTKKIFCRLLKTGEPDSHGLGALREVRSGMLCFEEHINAFNAPNFYEYRIRRLRGPLGIRLPFQHRLGRIELEHFENKTRAVWVSQFHFAIPLIGTWLDRTVGAKIATTFQFFLTRLEQRLQSSA